MKKQVEVILHWVIVVTTIIAVCIYFIGGPDILGSKGAQCFKYFTTDSNILAALASVMILVCTRAGKRPKWVEVFFFVSTVAVSITLFTVLFFLAPSGVMNTHNFLTAFKFFKGNAFVLHFSTPVLALIVYIFGNSDYLLPKKGVPVGIISVVIYSIVYLILVVILEVWRDWYGFTFGGHKEVTPIVMLCMYLFAALMSFLIWKAKAKIVGKRKKN